MNTSDLMKKANPAFFSKAIIPKEPSSKIRDMEKRDRVIALEIAIIKKSVNVNQFELCNPWRT